MEVLEREEWETRAAAHAARIDAYVQPHLARRRAHLKHPVFDFLFTYYSYRPAQLRRWHPGFGVRIEGLDADEVTVDDVQAQRPLISGLHRLLTATSSRPANLGCFGLHEWAMVYRLTEDQTRHSAWPLRLGNAGTDAVVDSHRIACSHFDAYRFFTPPARPLNTLDPGRNDRAAFEQPGCLHAGMDLYKHAFRLSPLICSDLVGDCFELAWDIRVMDMRAAPYDLTGVDLGAHGDWTPIRIETAEGKREYADLQRHYAGQAAPIRQRLIEECERLMRATG